MKKIIALLLVSLFLFAVCSCDSKTENESGSLAATDQTQETQASIDVDLTALSGTMIYAEVYNMMTNPDAYLGKTVKMRGSFAVYEGASRNYYACLISDATACCSQGIEFILDGNYSYPNDYPEPNSEITVTGVFDTYTEGDYLYCQLIGATLEQ
ncbi:MAG: hypothetical protein ACI3X1_08120 [Eubacteriales bacterium]